MNKSFTIEGISFPRYINSKKYNKIINFENLMKKERTLRSKHTEISKLNMLIDLRVLSFGLKQIPIMIPYDYEDNYILTDYYMPDRSLCIFYKGTCTPRMRSSLESLEYQVIEFMPGDHISHYNSIITNIYKKIPKRSILSNNLEYEVELPEVDLDKICASCRDNLENLLDYYPHLYIEISSGNIIELNVSLEELRDAHVGSGKQSDRYRLFSRQLENCYGIKLNISKYSNKNDYKI